MTNDCGINEHLDAHEAVDAMIATRQYETVLYDKDGRDALEGYGTLDAALAALPASC